MLFEGEVGKGNKYRWKKVGKSCKITIYKDGKSKLDDSEEDILGMIERKITKKIEEFFNSNDKEALLITGARQVGKTFSIREYGKRCFKNFVEINFYENKEAVSTIEGFRDTKDLLTRISSLVNCPLEKGNTLVFLDEVQLLPDILTAIKFLVDDGRYRYILSGSLLGLELKNIRSIPVGYLAVMEMHPLSIEEFFLANGLNKSIISTLKDAYENSSPVEPYLHEKLMSLFRLYLVVGGMPRAVQVYLNTYDLNKVLEEQEYILGRYREDVAQHVGEENLFIKDIFEIIPSELNNPNKRFILKNLNEKIKFNKYEESFIWLAKAGIALPVFNVEEPKAPLELNKLRNLFKFFSNDVGLLASQYTQGIQARILRGDDSINYGCIYENAVAEELFSNGLSLFYFNSKKQGELDFVVKIDDSILPIEVKSGKNYSRHNALKNVMSNDEYGLKKAIVLTNDNVKMKGNIVYLPVYMAAFIRNSEMGSFIYKVDLTGLT